MGLVDQIPVAIRQNQRQLFFWLHAREREIFEAKNHDYGGAKEVQTDIWNNFREAERIGVPAWKGAMIRLMDKRQRSVNLVSAGTFMVKDEGLGDVFFDESNYARITLCLLIEEIDRLRFAWDRVQEDRDSEDPTYIENLAYCKKRCRMHGYDSPGQLLGSLQQVADDLEKEANPPFRENRPLTVDDVDRERFLSEEIVRSTRQMDEVDQGSARTVVLSSGEVNLREFNSFDSRYGPLEVCNPLKHESEAYAPVEELTPELKAFLMAAQWGTEASDGYAYVTDVGTKQLYRRKWLS